MDDTGTTKSISAKQTKKAKTNRLTPVGSTEGITLDMHSGKLHAEFLLAFKSVLHLSSSNIHLVVFTNDLGKQTIQDDIMTPLIEGLEKARALNRTHRYVCWTPVVIQPALVRKYIRTMGFRLWTPRWALVKPFAYSLLPPYIDWVLQLDTDVILASDILELWNLRLRFNSSQAVGGAQEIAYIQGAKKLANRGINVPDMSGLNSGVVLYSAHRLQALNFSHTLVLKANLRRYPTWGDPEKVDPEKYRQLDQDLYNT
eukprot:gene5027-6127_t